MTFLYKFVSVPLQTLQKSTDSGLRSPRGHMINRATLSKTSFKIPIPNNNTYHSSRTYYVQGGVLHAPVVCLLRSSEQPYTVTIPSLQIRKRVQRLNNLLRVTLLIVEETGFELMFRRRRWHPTPVLLPGKSHGWRSLVGCSPWGREELDTTK